MSAICRVCQVAEDTAAAKGYACSECAKSNARDGAAFDTCVGMSVVSPAGSRGQPRSDP